MLVKMRNEIAWRTVVRRLYTELARKKIIAALSMGVLLISLLGGAAVYLVVLGAKLHRDHYIQGFEQTVRYVLHTNLGIPVNYFRGVLAPSPEILVLDIKHLDYQKIAFNREQSFKTGRIVEGPFVIQE